MKKLSYMPPQAMYILFEDDVIRTSDAVDETEETVIEPEENNKDQSHNVNDFLYG